MNTSRLSFGFGMPSSFGNLKNVKPPYAGGMGPPAATVVNENKKRCKNQCPKKQNASHPNISKPAFPNHISNNINSNDSNIKMAYNPQKVNNMSFVNNNNIFNRNLPFNNQNPLPPPPLPPPPPLYAALNPLNLYSGWNMYGITTPTVCCLNNFAGTNYMTTCTSGYCMNQLDGGFSRYIKTNTFAFY